MPASQICIVLSEIFFFSCSECFGHDVKVKKAGYKVTSIFRVTYSKMFTILKLHVHRCRDWKGH